MIVAKQVAVGVYRSNGYTLVRARSKVNRKKTYWKVLETDTVSARLKDLMLVVAKFTPGCKAAAPKTSSRLQATGNLFHVNLNQSKLF